MAALSDFHRYVSPEAKDAPVNAIDNALLFCLAEFCQEVKLWRVKHEVTDVLEVSNSYDLSSVLPPNTAIAEVVMCFWDGELLSKEQESERFSSIPGLPTSFGMSGTSTIALNPPAQQAGTLTAVIAVKPIPGCDTVDDALLNDWAEAISHGAIYRLQAQPEKPWSANAAEYHRAEYFRLQSIAARQTLNGRLDSGRSTRSRSYN